MDNNINKKLDQIREEKKKETILMIEKRKSFLEGFEEGLNIAKDIIKTDNAPSYEEGYLNGILNVIYELGKELDILTSDIRDDIKNNKVSSDDACDTFAKRIIENHKNSPGL